VIPRDSGDGGFRGQFTHLDGSDTATFGVGLASRPSSRCLAVRRYLSASSSVTEGVANGQPIVDALSMLKVFSPEDNRSPQPVRRR
jgi:hypothetical protein